MPLRTELGECLQRYGMTSHALFSHCWPRLGTTWRDRRVHSDDQPLPSSELMSSHSAWRFAWQL